MSAVNTSVELLRSLSEEYVTTPEQAEQFRRDGHVLLRGVGTAEEVRHYGAAIRGAGRDKALGKQARLGQRRAIEGKDGAGGNGELAAAEEAC